MIADAATLEPGTCFRDPYDVLAEIGSGTFGCVPKGRQRSTDRLAYDAFTEGSELPDLAAARAVLAA